MTDVQRCDTIASRRLFVDGAFNLLLGRAATADDVAGADGLGSDALMQRLMLSREFLTKKFDRFREAFYNDATDPYTNSVARYRAMSSDFRSGREVSIHSQDQIEFLWSAYLAILHRAPDAIGCINHLTRLRTKEKTREGIVRDLAGASEVGESLENALGLLRRKGPEQTNSISYVDYGRPDPSVLHRANQMLIVTGPPRSGTTILVRLLNSDNRICITNESRAFSLPVHLEKSLFLGEIAFSTSDINMLLLDTLLSDFGSKASLIMNNLRKCLVDIDMRSGTARKVSEGPPASVVGDKHPAYCSEGPTKALRIAKCFSGSKWLFIFRDPTEMFRSQKRREFVEKKAVAKSIFINSLQSASVLIDKLGKNFVFIVSYDRLFHAATFSGEVERLKQFLQMDCDTAFNCFISTNIQNPDKVSGSENFGINMSQRGKVEGFFDVGDERSKVAELLDKLGLWQ